MHETLFPRQQRKGWKRHSDDPRLPRWRFLHGNLGGGHSVQESLRANQRRRVTPSIDSFASHKDSKHSKCNAITQCTTDKTILLLSIFIGNKGIDLIMLITVEIQFKNWVLLSSAFNHY